MEDSLLGEDAEESAQAIWALASNSLEIIWVCVAACKILEARQQAVYKGVHSFD